MTVKIFGRWISVSILRDYLKTQVMHVSVVVQHDAARADDLVQEVNLRIARNAVPEDADLQRWAFRVCKNVWFDQLRRKRVRLEAADAVRELSPTFEDGATRTEERSELDFVMRAMSQLPEEQQFAPGSTWRFVLEDPHSGERIGFANVQAYVAFVTSLSPADQ